MLSFVCLLCHFLRISDTDIQSNVLQFEEQIVLQYLWLELKKTKNSQMYQFCSCLVLYILHCRDIIAYAYANAYLHMEMQYANMHNNMRKDGMQ